ncbi:MAG: cytochrome P450 [Caulobacteraceae bacterium]|nr:cytochrome P450 [Caulobacteraceae bacterium]
MSKPQSFDPAEYVKRLKVHSPEFAAHHNEVISHIPQHCPVFHAHMESFSPTEIDVAVIGGYEAIMATARDPEILSSQGEPEMFEAAKAGLISLNLPTYVDPPLAFEYRNIVDPFVSPRAAKELEPRVRELVRKLNDRMVEKGSLDIVQDVAQPLTAILTMWVTGLPEEKWFFYSDIIHRMLWRDGDPLAIHAEMEAYRKVLREDIERIRADPNATGVLGATRTAKIQGRPLEHWEAEGMLMLLLLGGVDTTQALTGSATVFLGHNPGHRQQIINNPEILPEAIEEFLRYHAPVLGTSRKLAKDVEVEGVKLKAGEQTLVCWAAANRDPAAFEDPNEVRFDRPSNRHLTFSVGPHRCLGSHVARMEIRVMLEEMFRLYPDFKLVEEGLQFAPDVAIIYGYKAVPLTFPPRKRELPEDPQLEKLLAPMYAKR